MNFRTEYYIKDLQFELLRRIKYMSIGIKEDTFNKATGNGKIIYLATRHGNQVEFQLVAQYSKTVDQIEFIINGDYGIYGIEKKITSPAVYSHNTPPFNLWNPWLEACVEKIELAYLPILQNPKLSMKKGKALEALLTYTPLNKYLFRYPESATILGLVKIDDRDCFHLLYSDGVESYAPVENEDFGQVGGEGVFYKTTVTAKAATLYTDLFNCSKARKAVKEFNESVKSRQTVRSKRDELLKVIDIASSLGYKEIKLPSLEAGVITSLEDLAFGVHYLNDEVVVTWRDDY